MSWFRRACLAALLVAPDAASAQEEDEQVWLAAIASHRLDVRSDLSLESIIRFGDSTGGLGNAQLGIAYRRQVADGIDLGIGYRHVQEWNHGVRRPNEERVRQLVSLRLGSGFTARAMLEERFPDIGETAIRLRPLVRFTAPLGRGSTRLFLWHEDFFNLNTTGWGVQSGYERTRQSAGVTVPIAKNLSTDIGYLNEYRFGRNGARDRMNHIANLILAIRF